MLLLVVSRARVDIQPKVIHTKERNECWLLGTLSPFKLNLTALLYGREWEHKRTDGNVY